ncbi:hypothetical protein LEMLEM_LOCUS4183, partial [Lemmus lemmus]
MDSQDFSELRGLRSIPRFPAHCPAVDLCICFHPLQEEVSLMTAELWPIWSLVLGYLSN